LGTRIREVPVLQSLSGWLRFVGCLAIYLSTPLYGQHAAPDLNGPIVFQTNAQSVVLDVVVTGRNGQPVDGLQRGDFLLSEDGHPQTITSFEEHTGSQPVQAPLPELPPNIFTNAPRVKLTDSVTILLFDTLNTPPEDLTRLRDQMLKYVKGLEPGRPMAIFVLGSRLRLTQGITTDSAVLTEALSKQKGGTPLLWSEADLGMDTNTVQSVFDVGTPFLKQLQADEKGDHSDSLVNATLAGFQELARSLAGIPGRKNVVWLSGSFPSIVLADPNLVINPSSVARSYADEVRKTDTLLAAARVAIYPIGAKGLATNPQPIDGPVKAWRENEMEEIASEHDTRVRNPDQATMDQVARETGGLASYDVNRLDQALGRVMDQGSHFYTLTYTPTNSQADGRYRKMEVRLSANSYKLSYRPGYYAAGGKAASAGADDRPLLSFMRPGMPDSTQIRFTLKVQPEASLTGASGIPQTGNEVNKTRARAGDNHKLKGLLTRYTVDFGIPAHDLIFDVASDGGRRGRLESMLVVYDRDGKPWNWLRRYFDLHWDTAEYASVQVHGIHFRVEIDVPKSGVYLQCGVYDQLSNETGTLKILLSSVVTGRAAASKSFAEAPAPSSGVPEVPATPPSGTLAVPPKTTIVQTQTATSASLAAVPTIPAHGPEGNQATPASGKDLPLAYAKPANFLDAPLQSLKTAVPTLDGLNYDARQDQLPAILARLAETIDDVLPRLPDLVSREEVVHGAKAPLHPISTVLGNLSIEGKSSEEYKYLIICHHAANGATTVEESRTDRSGQPIQPDKLSLLAYGLAYQWLLFSGANQPELRFRYLGQQSIDGRKTFVVAFAQKPEQVAVPAHFIWGGKPIPIFYQGVLWIDQSSSNVALIRTDLLEPLPNSQLQKLTTDLHFSSVRIHDLGATFWLPREVHIVVQETNTAAEEDHQYSDYHLYHATVRMVPSP
jgi:VWFA-related protein